MELSLERFPLDRDQLEVDRRYHLARALAHAVVTHGEHARVSPVAVEGGVLLVGRHGGQLVEHLAAGRLADALDEVLERLARIVLGQVAAGDQVDRLRDVARRHRPDRQTVGAGVVAPLAAQHHLEVRDRVVVALAAHAVEAQVGDVMLTAGVEAARHLDAQAADHLVQLHRAAQQALADLPGQPARGSDAQLAGVCARARRDVHDRAGAGGVQIDFRQFAVERRQVCLADPAQDHVLLDGGAHRLPDVGARDVGQLAELPGGDVPQRQRDRDRGVAGLTLPVDVRGAPGAESRRRLHAVGGSPRLQRQLLEPLRLFDVLTPARIVRELRALGQHQAPELVDAELLDQELDAGAARFFFSPRRA